MSTFSAKAEMLIKRTVRSAYDAFVDPGVMTQFWLERASAPLTVGAVVRWDFMVAGAFETVTVTHLVEDKHIGFDWSDGIHVDIEFEDLGYRTMRVSVTASGFKSPDGAVAATEGFTIVLCDLKTLLESGRSAQLVRSKADLIEHAMKKPEHSRDD